MSNFYILDLEMRLEYSVNLVGKGKLKQAAECLSHFGGRLRCLGGKGIRVRQ